jgi:hypothetical protein
MKYKTKFALTLALILSVIASADAASPKTMDALPAWDVPHIAVHIEDVPAAMSRLGRSFLFETLEPGFSDEDFFDMSRMFHGWVNDAPVESLSLVKGVKYDDEDTFYGAVSVTPDKRGLLPLLPTLTDMDSDNEVDGDYDSEALEKIVAELFGILPGYVSYVFADEVNLFNISFVFDFLPELYASVEGEGDEYLLLFASDAEGV